MNDQIEKASVGILDLLFVLFLGLKIAGVIGWSWWWVTAPLWIPAMLLVVIYAALRALR